MPKVQTHYAHSRKDRPIQHWHELSVHLNDTAERAQRFAATFAPGWGHLAGLWHDAGKYQRAFQNRIGVDPDAHTDEKVDHSTVGALIAFQRKAMPLAFVIAGHHGGLPDKQNLQSRLEAKANLLAESRRDGLPAGIESVSLPAPPDFPRNDSRKLALWTRFLFSALVDADFLDTERFYEGKERELPEISLACLSSKLDQHLTSLQSSAPFTPVNAMRTRILNACRAAAEDQPGAFTLTVPTGGGKTLASVAFALRHALKHDLRRVIVAIPFTSIIEQTACIYRSIFGEDAVVEHHSNIDPDKERHLNRIAAENWDAPIIVTTNVQFFEGLFANRTSRCRKLHRIAKSVVIFDEVQTFPPGLLEPVRDAIAQLVSDYGVSAVLCTATQPALSLPNCREIVPNVIAEFAVVSNRCRFHFPEDSQPVTWSVFAEEVRPHKQCLIVVNKRNDAEQLARLLGDDCFHLSARMCAAHRSAVFSEIRKRLQAGEACHVVSTQLVEAGVDIDFPVVYRAFAGADSLAQSAGRCNREGRLSEGELNIFFPPSQPPRGLLRTAKQCTETLWREGSLNLQDPTTFREYFRRLYASVNQDPGVMAAERNFEFEEVAKLFRMIEETGEAVVAPFADAQQRLEQIRRQGITRYGLRRLQPFLVTLYPQEIQMLLAAGAIERVEDKLWCVAPVFKSIYSPRFGFGWAAGPIAAEPENLIA